jgi:hypothetical protein
MRRTSFLAITLLILTLGAHAQEEKKDTPSAKPVLSPIARLQAAKTAFVKNMDGTAIGAETITATLEGWGRYKIVNTPERADLIVEVTSPSDSEGGVSVSSSSSTGSGKYEQSNKSSRELSSGGGPMRMVVRDAKTTATLFVASEQVKGAMKRNARENNLVDAAQKLVAKFHERVEPVKSPE